MDSDCETMDCEKTEELIFLVLDNQMGPDEVVAYERHVSLCPTCARRAKLTHLLMEFVKKQHRATQRCAPQRLRLKIRARLQTVVHSEDPVR